MEDQLGLIDHKKDESKSSEESEGEKKDDSHSNPDAAKEIDNELLEKNDN